MKILIAVGLALFAVGHAQHHHGSVGHVQSASRGAIGAAIGGGASHHGHASAIVTQTIATPHGVQTVVSAHPTNQHGGRGSGYGYGGSGADHGHHGGPY